MDTESGAAAPVVAVGIRLHNIDKSFGKTRVLKDFSLDVFQGELCCLLGPSGCGKTTALKIIDGLLEHEGGRIFLGDKDITNLPTQKRNLGMVFQNYALFPQMDVFDNVAYGLRRRRVPNARIKTRVHSALEAVRLVGYEDRRIHELSGGQQQRVALARALVIEPKALLLDEPLSNLDARLRTDMRQEIKRIQKNLGITTIYVTHDQEEAMSIADRIVVMNEGVVEQIGTPREIYENPETRFVADFIGRINFIPVEHDNKNFKLLGKEYPLPGELVGIGNARLICAIRPERVQVTKEAISRAVVLETFYIGTGVRYKLAPLDYGGAEIEAEVYTPMIIFGKGDEVGVEMKSEDIRLFPDGNQ